MISEEQLLNVTPGFTHMFSSYKDGCDFAPPFFLARLSLF